MHTIRNPQSAIRNWTVWLVLAMSCIAASPAQSQSAAALVAMGDSAHPRLRPDSALPWYRAAIAADSGSYDAWWKAGQAITDVGKQVAGRDDASRARRDSLYFLAADYARRAIRIEDNLPDAHVVLATALGRLSLTRGGRDRVKFGKIIYNEASFAIQLAPGNDAGHHIVGVFHAEVKRLPGPTRFFARLLFGAKLLGASSWDSATVHLERAVQLAPDNIYHRLELARVYLDIGRNSDAAAQLEAIAGLPDGDVLDPEYRGHAAELLKAISARSARGSAGAGG